MVYLRAVCSIAFQIFLATALLAALTTTANAVVAIIAPPPPPVTTSCIWFSDDYGIYQVSTDTNRQLLNIALPESRALAMNASDCGVWALTKTALYHYDASGLLVYQVTLKAIDPKLDDAHQLVLDTYDGSLWLADERNLLHVSATGKVIGKGKLPGRIRQLAIAVDESVWALGGKRLWHIDATAALVGERNLGHDGEDFRYLVVDSVGNKIWLGDDKRLVQIDASDTKAAAIEIVLPGHLNAVTLNPISGDVWASTRHQLLDYGRDTTLIMSVDLASTKAMTLQRLAFDPITKSLWAGSEHALLRFTLDGTLAASLLADADDAIGTAAFEITPTVAIVQPPQNALTNNPTPMLALSYDALCNNQRCEFPNSYFARYSPLVTLNALPIGKSFVFNATTGQATYTSPTRLPEGLNVFSSLVQDGFGHISSSVSSSFTIDTVPPKFLAITPANNSILSNPNVTIQGNIDDPNASVILSNLQSWGGTGANPAKQNFSWTVFLNPGLNVLNLSAVDLAGNVATLTERLTYSPPPITLAITSPVANTSITNHSVTVSGNFTGLSNTGITVNGQVAGISGNQFIATIPLQTGSNTIIVTATAPDGNSATQSVTITSSGAAPVSLTANPARGMAPLSVSFTLNKDTGINITRIDADFDGNGSIDTTTTDIASLSTTYSEPGIYQAKITVTDAHGNIYPLTQAINVQSASNIAKTLRTTFNGMTTNLRAGKIDAALSAVTGSVYEKYKSIFTTLQPNLPAIVDQLGTLQGLSVSNDMAEGVMLRNTANGPQAFLIYFLLSEDGVWRIDGM